MPTSWGKVDVEARPLLPPPPLPTVTGAGEASVENPGIPIAVGVGAEAPPPPIAFMKREVGVVRDGGGTGVVVAEDREPRVGGSEAELDSDDGVVLGRRSTWSSSLPPVAAKTLLLPPPPPPL